MININIDDLREFRGRGVILPGVYLEGEQIYPPSRGHFLARVSVDEADVEDGAGYIVRVKINGLRFADRTSSHVHPVFDSGEE